MPKFAVIANGEVAEYRDLNYTPTPEQIRHTNGLPNLRPVRFVSAQGYDSRVHTKSVQTTVADTEVVQEEVLAERPLADVKAETMGRINAECRSRIYAKYSRETQQSAVLGIYGQAFLDTMKDEIASMVQTSNAACDAVNNATTVQAAVAAEGVTWPL